MQREVSMPSGLGGRLMRVLVSKGWGEVFGCDKLSQREGVLINTQVGGSEFLMIEICGLRCLSQS
jgi:hypothetical protein